MNIASTARVTPRRRWLHTALGTSAMSLTAVATIAIGARAIGVAPAPDEIPIFCPGTAQCEQQNTVGPDLEAPLVHRHL
jgi:hypothetical protein